MEHRTCNIKGFEGLYYIYENGTIYSLRKKRYLKTHPNNPYYKYEYVCLTGLNGESLRTGIHRIIAHHFICPQPSEEHEVNHIDGDRANNHYTNLEWVTHRENIIKARHLKHWTCGRRKGDGGYAHSQETRHKMAISKYKKVKLVKDNQILTLDSIGHTAIYLQANRRTIERRLRDRKEIKGFIISLL